MEIKSKIWPVKTELETQIDLSRSELEVKMAELSGKMDSYAKRLNR